MADASADKKALLGELKIDRSGGGATARRPVKWFVALAVLAGAGFVGWSFGLPLMASPAVEVRLATASAAARPAAGESVLDATGYVVARRQATVSSKTTGKVLEVLVEEGMTVQEGQILAVLDDSIPRAQLALAESQLGAAEAALNEIRVNIRQAELDLQRIDDLAERQFASAADRDRNELALEALRARLARAEREVEVAARSLAVQRGLVKDFEIRAPFGGVVIAKAAQPGEMISPISAGGGFTRTGICTIVDMDSLEVEVDVNEAYINRVYPGQPVTARLNAYDEDLPAAVIATIPAADRNKATVRVRIGFAERNSRVLPDMGVKVAFLDAETGTPAADEPAPAAVLVPAAAVFGNDAARHVWVVEDGAAQRRDVETAGREGANARIVRGLAAGERVVAEASDDALAALRDGAEVVSPKQP